MTRDTARVRPQRSAVSATTCRANACGLPACLYALPSAVQDGGRADRPGVCAPRHAESNARRLSSTRFAFRLACRRSYIREKASESILEIPASDRKRPEGLTQFASLQLVLLVSLLILDGELSEWLKEHAWKTTWAINAKQLRDTVSRTRSAT